MTSVPSPTAFGVGVVDGSDLNNQVVDPLLFLFGKPIAVLRQTVAQSIPNGAATAITMDVEDVDSANGHDTSSNTSRYTAVYPGWYRLSGGASFAVNATGVRAAYWYKNGSVINGSEAIGPAATAVFHATSARSILVYLSVGDYVELYGYQTSGAGLNTAVSAEHQSTMIVEFVSN